MELDGRPGAYAKLEWRPPAPVAVEAFVYDNAGNPAVFKRGQWSWRTRFADLGLTVRPAPGLEVLAQALYGRTYFGPRIPRFVDEDFASALVLVSQTWARNRLTGRIDGFQTRDRSFKSRDDNDERG